MLIFKLDRSDWLAVFLTIALTFFLDYASGLPRVILLALTFPQESLPAPVLATAVFLAEAFFCGILSGMLALTASRRFVARSAPAPVAVMSSILLLAYSLFTIPLFCRIGSIVPIFADRLPGFLPVYLEICGALPGWLLGYYFASGAEAQKQISSTVMLVLTLTTSCIVPLVFVAPVYVPPDIQRVPDEFQPVPQPQTQTGPDVHIFLPAPQ